MKQKLSILATIAFASLRSEFQYRANVVTSILGGLMYQLAGFVTVWIIVDQFDTIGGWTLPEITLLYGMRLTSHGVFYLCFSQMFLFDQVTTSGEFDRYLIRPMSPLLQLFTRKLRVNCFGDLLGGVLLLSFATPRADIDWSPLAALLLVGAVIGGGLIEGAIQVTLGSLNFRFLHTLGLRVSINELFNQYGNYPTSMFPRVLEFGLTFLLPMAFVAFIPASTLLDKTDGLRVASWVGWFTPLVGMVLFSLAVRIWYGQSKHYQSSGH